MTDQPDTRPQGWRDFLTPDERARIEAIPAERAALTDEYKAIYNRARTRMYRAKVQ